MVGPYLRDGTVCTYLHEGMVGAVAGGVTLAETMATTQAMSSKVPTCRDCNLQSKGTGRSLCASCLNRNLQRACEKTIILSPGTPRIGPCAPRAFFPGMPRAVLGPIIKEKGHHIPAPHCRVIASSPSSGDRSSNGKPELHSCSNASKDSHNYSARSADEDRADSGAVARRNRDQQLRSEESKSFAMEGVKGADVPVEKWHLFQTRKNLTVRIPNPPSIISVPLGGPQPLVVPSKKHSYYSLPARKETFPRNTVRPSKVKKWTIRPDASAEAELMMRLLSDSIPILKPAAPLVLPPCKVRPAPISPLSPPGDPLWKRRCIPCPKSLKLQVTSICVS